MFCMYNPTANLILIDLKFIAFNDTSRGIEAWLIRIKNKKIHVILINGVINQFFLFTKKKKFA